MKIRDWQMTGSGRRMAFIGLILLLFVVFWLACRKIDAASAIPASAEDSYILIDPGHGGADGGAQGADGTLEKDINLAISKDLYDMIRLCGYPAKMTRDSDVSIHDASVTSLREQKISDMQNRLRLYEQGKLVISIHQNQFSQTQYFGTQIFYSGNRSESRELADSVRSSVLERLQPQNTRELKKADSNIYLLHKTTVPAILVECGFLSNAAEREQLKDAAYQQQMAFAILAGFVQYLP